VNPVPFRLAVRVAEEFASCCGVNLAACVGWFFRANQGSRAPSRRDSFKARFLRGEILFEGEILRGEIGLKGEIPFEARFLRGEIGLKARFLFLQGLKPLFRNWIQTGLLSEPSTVSPCCSGGRGVCFLLWGEPGRLRGGWFFRANQGSRASSRRDSFKARFCSKARFLQGEILFEGEIPLGEIPFEGRFRSKRDSPQSEILVSSGAQAPVPKLDSDGTSE
jgi:hypothetical protein